LPPAHRAAFTAEKTFKKLIGPLGTKPTIWAECVFVDPVSDLAVLGQPDGQAFNEDVDTAWDDFIEDLEPLDLDTDQPTRGWMLSLDGHWMPCAIHTTNNGSLLVKDLDGDIEGGMSGSPILSDKGRAVGVVTIGSG
jgi:exonuclease I